MAPLYLSGSGLTGHYTVLVKAATTNNPQNLQIIVLPSSTVNLATY